MLLPFSEPKVRDNFRVKICLDTNILDFYLDNEYPGLTRAINNLCDFSDFIDLVTTKYVLFELLEVRKREHFKIKAHNDFPLANPLSENNIRRFTVPNENANYYYTLLPQIIEDIKNEIEGFRNHSDIEIEGEIHKNLWNPTTDVCLSSKLSREDSLVLTSTLMPDELKIQDFLAVLTNDKDFHDYFHEAPNLNEIFQNHSLPLPEMCYIQNLSNNAGTQFNLTDNNTVDQVPGFVISYIKTLIIKKNQALYIGTTDDSFSTNTPDIIGIRLTGNIPITETNYITIVGNQLDFILTCPTPIQDFRNSEKNQVPFPINPQVNRVVFRWPTIEEGSTLKEMEPQILQSIKSSGNLVFLHPDSI